MKYVALLRGINVGGKNKVSMPELRTAFTDYGFIDVSHYINSGNILFSSENTDEVAIQSQCETLVKNRFQLDIPIAVISSADYIDALIHAPDWWGQDKESKHNAIFVVYPATMQNVYKQIGDIKPEYEKIHCYGKVIFWSAPVITFSRTRLSKIVSTSLYRSVTVRNVNTAMKLKELLQNTIK